MERPYCISVERIDRVSDLRVFVLAYDAAMDLFEASKSWPKDERYALVDQVRRSSRSVCANLAEAWAKRRYPAHFVSKLTDAHAEAEETLTWLRFSVDCGYVSQEWYEDVRRRYRLVIGGLVRMVANPAVWCTAR